MGCLSTTFLPDAKLEDSFKSFALYHTHSNGSPSFASSVRQNSNLGLSCKTREAITKVTKAYRGRFQWRQLNTSSVQACAVS